MQRAFVNALLQQALYETVVATGGLRPVVAVIEPESLQPLALLRRERNGHKFSSFCHTELILTALLQPIKSRLGLCP